MTKSYNSPFEHVDYNAIIEGTKGNGIISGLIVTERGAGQNMSVDVAAGSAHINKVEYVEASTVNVVITAADATHPRKDIIIYDIATTNPAVVTGTPAAEPIPPDITSGDILLAIVSIAANDTTIANTDIEDGRITIQGFHEDTHMNGKSDEIEYYNPTGNDIMHNNSTSRSTVNAAYTKLKEIDVANCGGQLRIAFRGWGDGGGIGYMRIYRNGVAVGTEQYCSATSDSTHYEIIDGWSDGDLVQIYGKRTSGSGTVYCSSLNILGNNIKLNYSVSGFTSQDP